MAKSSNSKSKPHLFLCCFGFSGKLRRFKPLKPAAVNRKRPFSWLRFHSKQPPAVRSTFPAEKNRSKPDSDRLSSKSVAPTATYLSNEDFAVAVPVEMNRAGEEIRAEEVKNEIVAEKIIFESCEHSDSPKKPADQSQSRFSLTRKLESFRLGRFTEPGSPAVKKNLKPTAVSHCLSFPPPNPTQTNRVNEALASMRVGLNKSETSKKFKPMTGMSILIITLAIMVLWGKLCAILCTATWIFIVTSLRSIVEEEDAIDFVESDSYSQGFKNKLMVFKGLLYKNHWENLFKKL